MIMDCAGDVKYELPANPAFEMRNVDLFCTGKVTQAMLNSFEMWEVSSLFLCAYVSVQVCNSVIFDWPLPLS